VDAARGRCGLLRLRPARALPLAGRQDAGGRCWFSEKAVPDCRTWERRIWMAWGRWGGQVEVHCALGRVPGHCAGSTDRGPNDWPDQRAEVLAYDPKQDLADGWGSIAPVSGRRARARLWPRAAGTERLPRWRELSRAAASARDGRANHRGRRRAEDGKRAFSPGGPTVRAVLVSRLHSMCRVDWAGLHRECRAWSPGDFPEGRRPAWHRAAFRCARVETAAVNPMPGEACLRHVCPHHFWPSALHAPGYWDSTRAGPGSRGGLVSSILRWLRAGRLPVLAVALVPDLVWSGGR
jgi:hypothetical protein